MIATLAARQRGVVARHQLLAVGLNADMIKLRLARRQLVRLHRGVYAAGHVHLRREGHWLAAVLAAGPSAVLSHRSAAALHGIRPSNSRAIDVTTFRRRASTRALRVHRARLEPADVTQADGIPVTTLARTIVDLAAIVPGDHLAKALAEADRRRRLDPVAIAAAAERLHGRRGPGHAALRAALAEHDGLGTSLTRSELERLFLHLVERAGLPRPRINARVAGMEVDAYWPPRVIAELDGWAFHRSRRAFQRDRSKATALTVAGFQVVRFTHADIVADPHTVVARLRTLLR